MDADEMNDMRAAAPAAISITESDGAVPVVALKSSMIEISDTKAVPPFHIIVRTGTDTDAILFCTPRLYLAVAISAGIMETAFDDENPARAGDMER